MQNRKVIADCNIKTQFKNQKCFCRSKKIDAFDVISSFLQYSTVQSIFMKLK